MVKEGYPNSKASPSATSQTHINGGALLNRECRKMVEEDRSFYWPPIGAPLNVQRDEHWRSFDNSVSAVSFGFVATAILISMFLAMAIFERFLRPTSPALSPPPGRSHGDLEAQMGFDGKLGYPSPKMTVYDSGVSVLMPGDDIPTFLAHPAPKPCPPECIPRPHHQTPT